MLSTKQKKKKDRKTVFWTRNAVVPVGWHAAVLGPSVTSSKLRAVPKGISSSPCIYRLLLNLERALMHAGKKKNVFALLFISSRRNLLLEKINRAQSVFRLPRPLLPPRQNATRCRSAVRIYLGKKKKKKIRDKLCAMCILVTYLRVSCARLFVRKGVCRLSSLSSKVWTPFYVLYILRQSGTRATINEYPCEPLSVPPMCQ